MTPNKASDTNGPALYGEIRRIPEMDGLELLHGSYSGTQRFPRHYHEEYLLSVMVRGTERLCHRGTTHTVPTGSVILLNPGEWHENYAWDNTLFAFRSLYVPVILIQRLSRAIHGNEGTQPYLRQTVTSDETLCRLLLRFHNAHEQRGSLLELESHLMETVACLLSNHTENNAPPVPPRSERRYIGQVRDYLMANYTENVSLDYLGALVGVTSFHLVRTFRDAVGVPPHEYQTHTRIEQAKRLLRAGLPLAETAAAVGFSDQSHLTRQFKRIVGVTPGQFSPNSRNIQRHVKNVQDDPHGNR